MPGGFHKVPKPSKKSNNGDAHLVDSMVRIGYNATATTARGQLATRHLPRISTLTGVLLLLALPLSGPAGDTEKTGINGVPSADSLQERFRSTVSALTSPELEARRARRRSLQREGYAEVLHQLLAGDAAGALFSWIRTSLQLEYSIPRRPLAVYIPLPATQRDTSLPARMMPAGPSYIMIPLHEDRSFPADPWAKPPEEKGP